MKGATLRTRNIIEMVRQRLLFVCINHWRRELLPEQINSPIYSQHTSSGALPKNIEELYKETWSI